MSGEFHHRAMKGGMNLSRGRVVKHIGHVVQRWGSPPDGVTNYKV